MPLEGEYAPSPWDWSREQADKYAESVEPTPRT